ncbi:chromosome segregation in meiosis-related protein [Neonectria magnoliae]|uniref:Chromosome segregation in meiosis protein n=1 Tax=Neonectria magnoliae TaxID=2732573 RepID=A0ABR1I4F2_9HYPO
MPSALASNPPAPTRHDDLDNYGVDDFSDDPFGSPPPDATTKKRKERESGLGLDEEVSVQKRARVPRVKLDEERLLGENGIPKLRARARDLKIKGKGHEFSDASRLLSFYQLWLDDLFPKAKFLDALSMVEKAGHKKRVMIARNEFINEGKPKYGEDEEQDPNDDIVDSSHVEASAEPTMATTITQRPKTPERDDDVPDDDDLYGATPRASRPIVPILNDKPEDADLEALVAEAEDQDRSRKSKATDIEPDGDDLDALIAEAEGQDQPSKAVRETTGGKENPGNDFADDEAAMQEMDGLW